MTHYNTTNSSKVSNTIRASISVLLVAAIVILGAVVTLAILDRCVPELLSFAAENIENVALRERVVDVINGIPELVNQVGTSAREIANKLNLSDANPQTYRAEIYVHEIIN